MDRRSARRSCRREVAPIRAKKTSTDSAGVTTTKQSEYPSKTCTAGKRTVASLAQTAGHGNLTGTGIAEPFGAAGRGNTSIAAGSPPFMWTRNLSCSEFPALATIGWVQVKDDLPCSLTARAWRRIALG